MDAGDPGTPARGNPEIGRHSAKAARRSAEVRHRLSASEVEQQLGALVTPGDAMRQLNQLVRWGASGRLAGTVLNGSVRGIEVWLKAFAEQMDVERVRALEARIRELEAERP
jgi:hypothetical protein